MAAEGRCRTATLGLAPASPVVAASSSGRVRRRVRWSAALATVLLVTCLGTSLLPGTSSDACRSGVIAVFESGKLHAGMTREEVHALLGPPDPPWPSHDGWCLGASPLGVDSEYYAVRYGPDGRVTGFGLVRG